MLEGQDKNGGDNTYHVMAAGKSELVRKRHGMGGMRNKKGTARGEIPSRHAAHAQDRYNNVKAAWL